MFGFYKDKKLLAQTCVKTKKPLRITILNGLLASQEGFEPPTVRLEGGCSIRLSYYDISATKLIIENRTGKVNPFSLIPVHFPKKGLFENLLRRSIF